jgi:hypothetical protein
MEARRLAAVAAVAFVVSACGSTTPPPNPPASAGPGVPTATSAPGPGTPVPTGGAPAGTGAEATPGPGSTQGPDGTPGTNPAATPYAGPLSLPDPAAGLDALPSYRAVLTRSFDGTQGGSPSSWSQTWTLTVDRSSGLRLLEYAEKGLPAGAAAFPALEGTASGAVYDRETADGACTGTFPAAGDPGPKLPEPASLLPRLRSWGAGTAEAAGGTPAQRHDFDASALGSVGAGTATGTVWVADQGGYVRRLALKLAGGADTFDADTSGTMTWAYEAAPPDPSAPIALPADCPVALPDLPVPAGAANVVRFPGFVAFETTRSVDALVTFYTAAMRKAGFAPSGAPNKGTLHASQLYAGRDGRGIQLDVTTGKPNQVQLSWHGSGPAVSPPPAP